tara:strand:- start:22 stop:192 length:171 start_codon:yes stop_codon:yes gene_type:complete
MTLLQLLKLGIPWEEINSFSADEIALILGIEAAMNEKQQEEQARQTATQQMNIKGF